MNTLNTSNPNNFQYKTQYLTTQVLGGVRVNKLESLRVTLAIGKPKSSNILRHSLDLYNDNHVEKFVRRCAERLEVGTSIVRKVIQELIRELENYRFILLDKQYQDETPHIKELTASEKRIATSFLKGKNLLEKTNELIGKSGVIGEVGNRLLMYLIYTSRKMENPLHCISFGSSGVGKTHLQSKVAELIPDEDKIEITVLSANAFYYFNRTELQHKLILIEDMDGAESVLYPLRELQSKKRITKTVVHKDSKGTTKTIHLTVEGPVSVAGCTTQEHIYEDNSNRSFLLYIDESSEQDQRIMNYQRKASAGKVNYQNQIDAQTLLKNVQRFLSSVTIRNPFAEYLSLPSSVFKPRRTNIHYLQFIEAITFYCQWQRQKKYDEQTGEEYIETTIEDIENANRLISETLLHKSDLLSGACRQFFEVLKAQLITKEETTFTNSDIRRWMRLGKSTVRRRFLELLDLGLITQINKKDKKTHYYELSDKDEYKDLKTTIDKALQDCIDNINQSKDSHRTTSM